MPIIYEKGIVRCKYFFNDMPFLTGGYGRMTIV